MDEFAELFGNMLGLCIVIFVLIGVALIVGTVLVPVGMAGAGGLFYLYNIHLPEKHRREAQHRTRLLYDRAQNLSPSMDDLEQALIEAGIASPALHRIARELYTQEGLRPPVLPPVGDDPIKLARYQDTLETFISAARPDQYQEFERHLIWALSAYEPDTDANQMFHCKRQRSKLEIEQMLLRFVNQDGLFKPLVDQINANYRAENELMPTACKHDNYVWRYLKDTPLLPLADVDEMIGLQDRMYHTYLLGSSGSGKTNLIENIIAHDLQSDEDCCVIVIDSQTQLTEKLAALDIPDTTHITPKYDLALNLFDVGYEDMKGRGIEGETLINKTVGLLSFVLEGMMWAEFTNPQRTIFQYVIQLVISIPGGNIYTFMDVLADGGHERYATEISQLDENMQRFFAVDYPAPDYKRTREAIRRRMDGLLLNPTFRRLFSATENKIDMFEEMANQKLILIDTNKPMLDDAPSAFFGRLFIALILRASYRRFGAGASKRPVYLIVDEAHEYFDRSISDMLEQARKANIGLVVAHQSISQARGAKGGSIHHQRIGDGEYCHQADLDLVS
jgi:GTPase SAR1 family protein